MARKVTPFLMFEGKAEAAIDFYKSVFGKFDIRSLERYGAGEPGPEGSVKRAAITVNGQDVMCIDSPVKHGFTFTPAISMFVDCEDEAEIDDLFGKLSEGGQVLMPLNAYPFASKFGWVADRFGVSWQLNLA